MRSDDLAQVTSLDYVFSLNAGHRPLNQELFSATALARDLTYLASDEWAAPRSDGRLVVAGEILRATSESVLGTIDDVLFFVWRQGPSLRALTAAEDLASAEATVQELRRQLPSPSEDMQPRTTVTYWNWDGRNARQRERRIRAAQWPTLSGNYSSSVRSVLDPLLALDEPPTDGRLILWHGAPGTGKTHLIRALAEAWSTWCSTHYVVDIDALLHGNSEYLTGMLLDAAEDDRWRLLVLEDAGEFLRPDSARSQGQGFSRLLNTLDGMLGQGARVLCLVTTNQQLGDLDPAITRPGRCSMALEVPPLSAEEATDWLRAHGSDVVVHVPATLAELYAVLRGAAAPQKRRPVGFIS